MYTTCLDEVESDPEGDLGAERRSLSDHLETTNVAVNHYRLEPGDRLVGGLHAHLDQEEVFYVIDGTLTFEVKTDATAETDCITLEAGGAVRFAPGEFQQGRNESHDTVTLLALGAPKESTQGRVPKTCPACGDSEFMDTIMVDGNLQVECPNCGTIRDSGLH